MSFDRTWLEESGSEGSNGSALWSGEIATRVARSDGIGKLARASVDDAVVALA
jgi:hypothetical protein